MAESKKLLYVASTMAHINNFHRPYIDALRDHGHEVLVMARGEGADFDIPFEKKLFSGKNRECRRMIREIINSEDFDAIVLNTSLAAFHVRLSLPRRRPRVVNVVHGYLFSHGTPPLKRAMLLLAEKFVRRRTDAIITMNSEDYGIAARHRLARGKVFFSRGMGATVRPSVSSPEKIRKELFPEGAYVMTFVGELSKRKNQSFLIEALAEIKKTIPEAALCLVGDGENRGELEALAERLGVGSSVIFAGHRDDACDFLRATDLYVSASVIEGLPFNVVEALGVGKTVLVSDVKGHSDIVEGGVDGYLYNPDDMSDFVNKACQIYREQPLPEDKIKEKYLKYERTSVFPETLLLLEESLLIDD
ncbi:MAG: glycosyltransferase [Clostridia bacterium]|nr:glycosyltransferase [Clostridia bacterium]